MAPISRCTIRFLGLAALVPPRSKGDPWLSVLPNLRSGAPQGAHGVPYAIAPHQALVAVSQRDLVDTEVPAKLRAKMASPSLGRMLPEQDELVFLEPDSEAISMTSGDPGLVVENQEPAAYGTAVAAAGEEGSLCWVPPLARVSAYSRFDRRLLAADGDGRQVVPSDDRLAATFVIDRGRLASTGVIRAAEGPVLYEFRTPDQAPGAGGWKQSLATGYGLEVTQAEETFVLAFEGAAGDRREVELRGNDVSVWVINRELEEILGFSSAHESMGEATSGDEDFACFYSLAEGWDDANPGETPIPFVRTEGVRGRNKPCGSPQFSA